MPNRTQSKHRRRRATSPSVEQYIETIAWLLSKQQVTTISDIAEAAGVSRPAASRSVRDLAEKELVEHKAYGYVSLTPKGQALATKLYARHESLFRFLREVLNFAEKEADDEACRLEHQVDDHVVDRIALLTDFFEKTPGLIEQWRGYLAERTPQEIQRPPVSGPGQ